MVFNREKLIDFSGGNNTFPFDMKHLSAKPKAVNKQGEKVLKGNAKFWIIYLRIISDKLSLENKKDLVKEI